MLGLPDIDRAGEVVPTECRVQKTREIAGERVSSARRRGADLAPDEQSAVFGPRSERLVAQWFARIGAVPRLMAKTPGREQLGYCALASHRGFVVGATLGVLSARRDRLAHPDHRGRPH